MGLHVRLKVFFEPTTEKNPVSVNAWLTDDGGSVNVNGLNRDLTILGAEAGAIVGLVLLTDPFSGGIFGAILGYAGAEAAEDVIRDVIDREATKAIAKASTEMNTRLQALVKPNANRIYDALALLGGALML